MKPVSIRPHGAQDEAPFVRAIRSAQVGMTEFALSTRKRGLLRKTYLREFGRQDGNQVRLGFRAFRDAHRSAFLVVSRAAAQEKGLLLWGRARRG